MAVRNRVGDQEVQVDRRRKDRRSETSLGVDAPASPTNETRPPRRKKQRRRQIDPTTCERDYNQEEIDFMRALDEYKRASGRMFPTCSEILEVVRSIGYVKLTDQEREILESLKQVDEVLSEVDAVEQDAECGDDASDFDGPDER